MKSLKKFIASGIFISTLWFYKSASELFENHSLDTKKSIYYATRENFDSYYSAFDSELNKYIFFKDYRCDNILDAVVYQDEEEIDLERDYHDLSNWSEMFNKILREVKKGKAVKEKDLSDFLCKHYYKRFRIKKKDL